MKLQPLPRPFTPQEQPKVSGQKHGLQLPIFPITSSLNSINIWGMAQCSLVEVTDTSQERRR
jgi:hypothetical protein